MDFDAVEDCLALKHNRKLKRTREIQDGEARLSVHAQAAAKLQRRLRRFSRYRFDARIKVSVFREGQTTVYWGRASELGLDGIGATLSGELQNGEVVSLEFPIPLAPYLLKLRAVVRYSDGLRCGFEFLVVTDEQRQAIHQFCVVLANVS
jgi:PilZ domain-containing protein